MFQSSALRLGGLLSHPFTMSKETFVGFWMWDACMHAIAGSWYPNRELVWGHLLNIENVQYPPGSNAAGTITNQAQPYGVDLFVSDDPMAERRFVMPHLLKDYPNHGDGSHPPLFAQALEAVWSVDRNERNLRRLLQNALAHHEWFERRRASKRVPGLLLVRRWSDSGMDNSKRWGRQGSGIYDTEPTDTNWSLPIITVDVNVYSVLEKQALARLLEATGQDGMARRFRAAAARRARCIHDALWDERRGFYMDCEEATGRLLPVFSPAGLYPLILDDLDSRRADRLLEQLFDERRFWSRVPLPSLALDDPDFRAEHSYSSGTVWAVSTAYILRALLRHHPKAGLRLLDRVLDMLVRDGTPYVYENYNPLTGQGYDAANFQWHGLLVDIVLRDLLGLIPGEKGLKTGPGACPPTWNGWRVENLYYHRRRYTITAARTHKGYKTAK